MNLEPNQQAFIKLISRSPDRGEGWRSVSDALKQTAIGLAEEQPELYETKEEAGSLFLRFTFKGSVLSEYL